MCFQIVDNGGVEMNLGIAMVYLMRLKKLTHDNAIVWTEWCDYKNGIENYYYQDTEEKYFALLTLNSSTEGEKFQLYVEDDKANWYVFDDRYNPVLANIYNWMTTQVDENDKSTIIDADYSVVEDNTPFEFVVNGNYNFESLG
jgi:hypothetical protein